jgi:hypothetical protein
VGGIARKGTDSWMDVSGLQQVLVSKSVCQGTRRQLRRPQTRNSDRRRRKKKKEKENTRMTSRIKVQISWATRSAPGI